MSNSGYKQQIEATKSQIKYLESLTPEERRASIIQMRKDQARGEIVILILLAVMGLPLFVLAIYTWVVEYNMSLMSSLGMAGGAILNVTGFRYLKSSSRKSTSKILSDDFTDEDIIAYLRERERSDEKALDRWNKRNKYLVSLFLLILMSLYFIPLVREFVVILFNSGIALSSIGFVVYVLIQQGKHRSQQKRRGS